MHNLALVVALPLLAAFLIPVVGRISPWLSRATGPLVLLVCLGLVLSNWGKVDEQAVAFVIGGFMPPYGIVFYIDQLSLLFSLLVPLILLLFWPWQRAAADREYSLWMLLTASSFGLVLSGDLFNIYVFYELLAVASYGLIAARDSSAAYAASIRYLILSTVGSVLFLLGISIIYTQTGTLNIAQLSLLAPEKLTNVAGLSAFALILIGAGVKAELFPVNSWVAEVYGSVSGRLAAILAGLVSKLAVLLIVRMLMLVFQMPEAMQLMAVLGMLGFITGELVAWRAKDMTRMLSFSSIGQLGLIILAFSLPGETGMLAGVAVMLHHLLVKPALFMLAEGWHGPLVKLTGAAKKSPLAAALFVLLAMSLLGIPPLPGFWAKMLVVMNLATQAQPIYTLALAAVLFATVIEAAYLFKVVTVLYHSPELDRNSPERDIDNGADPDMHDAVIQVKAHRKTDLAIAGVLGLVLIIATLWIQPLENKLTALAVQAADKTHYINTVFPAAISQTEVHGLQLAQAASLQNKNQLQDREMK